MAITKDTSAPAPPTRKETRADRGLELYRERGHEIESIGHGRYEVPGCSGGSYTVDLAVFGGEETCSCPDRHREYSCKHLVAATIFRAKSRAKARRAQHQRTASRAARASLAPVAL